MATHVIVLPGLLGSRINVHYGINPTSTASWEPGRVDLLAAGGVVLNPYSRIELDNSGTTNQGGGTTTLAGVVPGYYDELLAALKKAYPVDHIHMVTYDWRLSIRDSWQSVEDYFVQKIYPTGEPFQIVGHSLGGLVARVLWKRASALFQARCQRIVCLGTPHWGSWDIIRCFYQLDALYAQCYSAAQWTLGNIGIQFNPFTATPGGLGAPIHVLNPLIARDLNKALTSWPAIYECLPNPYAPVGFWASSALPFLNESAYPDRGAVADVSLERFNLRLAGAATTLQLLADPTTMPPPSILADVISDTLESRIGIVGAGGPAVDSSYVLASGDGRVYLHSAQANLNTGFKVDAEHFEIPRIVANKIVDILNTPGPFPDPSVPEAGVGRPYPTPLTATPIPPAVKTQGAPAIVPASAPTVTKNNPPASAPAPVAAPWGPGVFNPGATSPLSGFKPTQ